MKDKTASATATNRLKVRTQARKNSLGRAIEVDISRFRGYVN